MDGDWEELLDDAKEKMLHEIGKYGEHIRDLEGNCKRYGEVIRKLECQIAQMRQALQPILDCRSGNGNAAADCLGMAEMEAVRKAKAEMARDPDQYHADYYCTRHTWDEGTIAHLCKALDPLYDLENPKEATRETLLNAVLAVKKVIVENDKYFKAIGDKHRDLKAVMERLGEW